MKLRIACLSLAVINVAFLLFMASVMPDQMLGKMDLQGRPVNYTPKTLFIVEIVILSILTNALLFAFTRTNPEGKFFRRINIPYKRYWLETPERRLIAHARVSGVLGATGLYVNVVIFALLYLSYWFHFPQNVPCPKPALVMLGILTFGVLLVLDAWRAFRPPKGS